MFLYINGKLVADKLRIAGTFYERFRGLMFENSIGRGEGLMFENCRWIHSFFMRFPLDVVYLNGKNKIVGITRNLDTWTLCAPRLRAKHVIELWPGAVEENNIIHGGVASVSSVVR